jgi:hypothetical protein
VPTFWGVTAPGVQLAGGPKWFAVHVSNITASMKKMVASFAVFTGEQGPLVATMKKMTAAITGQQLIGTIGATEKQLTASLSGFVPEAGTLAALGKQMAANFVAAQTDTGTITSQGKQLTAALSGSETEQGTIGATMFAPTNANFVASMGEAATLASAMKQLTAAASGVEIPSGAIASALLTLSANLQGVEIPSGVIAATQMKLAAALAGGQTQSGSIASLLKKMLSALSGSIAAGPVFDAIGAGVNATATSQSENHTATAGATVLAFLIAASTGTPTGVTYGGSAMTLHDSQVASTIGKLSCYKLAGVAGGLKACVASWSASTNACLNTISYNSVTTIGTATKNTGSSASVSTGALTDAAQQIIVGALANPGRAITSPTGGTLHYNNATAPALVIEDSASSTTFSGTVSSSAWAAMGIVLS